MCRCGYLQKLLIPLWTRLLCRLFYGILFIPLLYGLLWDQWECNIFVHYLSLPCKIVVGSVILYYLSFYCIVVMGSVRLCYLLLSCISCYMGSVRLYYSSCYCTCCGRISDTLLFFPLPYRCYGISDTIYPSPV